MFFKYYNVHYCTFTENWMHIKALIGPSSHQDTITGLILKCSALNINLHRCIHYKQNILVSQLYSSIISKVFSQSTALNRNNSLSIMWENEQDTYIVHEVELVHATSLLKTCPPLKGYSLVVAWYEQMLALWPLV